MPGTLRTTPLFLLTFLPRGVNSNYVMYGGDHHGVRLDNHQPTTPLHEAMQGSVGAEVSRITHRDDDDREIRLEGDRIGLQVLKLEDKLAGNDAQLLEAVNGVLSAEMLPHIPKDAAAALLRLAVRLLQTADLCEQ